MPQMKVDLSRHLKEEFHFKSQGKEGNTEVIADQCITLMGGFPIIRLISTSSRSA